MLLQMADPKEPTPNDPEKPDTDAADTGESPEDVAMDRTAAAGGGAEQSAAGGQKSSETREKMSSAARSAQDRASKAASAARDEASRSYSDARSSISDSDDRTIAIVSYILYLATFVTGGIAAIVGVILAYLKRDTENPVLAGHYEYLIRTFWIGLVGSLICIVLFFVIIGIPLFIALAVWWLLRLVVGVVRLLDNKPIPDPKTWLI